MTVTAKKRRMNGTINEECFLFTIEIFGINLGYMVVN